MTVALADLPHHVLVDIFGDRLLGFLFPDLHFERYQPWQPQNSLMIISLALFEMLLHALRSISSTRVVENANEEAPWPCCTPRFLRSNELIVFSRMTFVEAFCSKTNS